MSPQLQSGRDSQTLDDARFRALLGRDAWNRLPATVRARFAKCFVPGLSVTYAGTIAACRMTLPGRVLAQLCRFIGAPLPLGCDTGLAAIVSVTEDLESGGQVWTRMYARRRGFPQVIHSAKRFAGPTGLEEYLGCGFGIALKVDATDEGIRFTSDHYFMALGQRHLRLPFWLEPGALQIDHTDMGHGCFAFTLSLRHRLLGELIHQLGHFHDQPVKKEDQL
jgi:hypothetical protein